MECTLVEQARQGDEDAYASLVRSAADRLYGIAYRILRDPTAAEDALQEALIAICWDLPGLRDPDRFDAWTYRLIVRASYREAARGRRWSRKVRAITPSWAGLRRDEDDFDRLDDREEIEAAFRRLTPEHRAVMVLRHFVGLEPSEIADALGIPVGTVGSRLHYARGCLRGAVEADARACIAKANLA